VINRSANDLFDYWRDLENLPGIMPHLTSVKETGGDRSHWVATGPMGVELEWDAEIYNEDPGRMIAWRSLPGTEVQLNVDREESATLTAGPGGAYEIPPDTAFDRGVVTSREAEWPAGALRDQPQAIAAAWNPAQLVTSGPGESRVDRPGGFPGSSRMTTPVYAPLAEAGKITEPTSPLLDRVKDSVIASGCTSLTRSKRFLAMCASKLTDVKSNPLL